MSRSILRTALVSVILSLSIVVPSYAKGSMITVTPQDFADVSGMVGTCDCEYCKKIEEIFANETDNGRRELSVQVWKASIHPELFVNAGNAIYLGTFPEGEGLKYTTTTLGPMQGWPRSRIVSSGMKVYYDVGSPDSVSKSKATLNTLYDILVDMRNNTTGKSQTDTMLFIAQKVCDTFSYTDARVDGYVFGKMSQCLSTNTACCVGYATLFKLGCNMCGVPASYVGNEEHIFNAVLVDGVERYVDCVALDVDTGYSAFLFGDEMLTYPWVIEKRG